MENLFETKFLASKIPRTYLYRLFLILDSEPEIETKRLIQRSRLPEALLKTILQEFQSFLMPPNQKAGFVVVKSSDRNSIHHFLVESYFQEFQDYQWLAAGLEEYNALLTKFNHVLAKRIIPKRSLDQFLCTIDTLVRRALFLKKNVDPSQKVLLFLGDDDYTSIAASLVFAECQPAKSIIVLDIDEDVLSNIRGIAEDNHLTIRTYHQDFRLDLSAEISNWKNRVDVIFTDPPYTMAGMGLFLHRGLELLRFETGIIYACFGYSIQDLVMGLKFQNLLTELKLIPRIILENFNVYNEAASIGSTSNLYALRPAQHIKLQKDLRIAGPLYTGYSESEKISLLDSTTSPALEYQLKNPDIISKIVSSLIAMGAKNLCINAFHLGPLMDCLQNEPFALSFADFNPEFRPSTEFMQKNKLNLIVAADLATSDVKFDTLLVESPLHSLDQIQDWMQMGSCKHLWFCSMKKINSTFESSQSFVSNPYTWHLLTLFWEKNEVIPLKSTDFEPPTPEIVYLYHFSKMEKNPFKDDLGLFVLRDMFFYSHSKVKNGLLNALINAYTNYGETQALTKRQGKELIDGLHIPDAILDLEFNKLTSQEFETFASGLKALKK